MATAAKHRRGLFPDIAISFKSYYPDTQTHTPDRLLYLTTKMIRRKTIKMIKTDDLELRYKQSSKMRYVTVMSNATPNRVRRAFELILLAIKLVSKSQFHKRKRHMLVCSFSG